MGERPKVTALILSHNVEDLIEGCLESVKWADEILVVDSWSADRTLEIAKSRATRVLQHDYPVILGTVLFGAVLFVVVNLLVDASYAVLDPRVRLRGQAAA